MFDIPPERFRGELGSYNTLYSLDMILERGAEDFATYEELGIELSEDMQWMKDTFGDTLCMHQGFAESSLTSPKNTELDAVGWNSVEAEMNKMYKMQERFERESAETEAYDVEFAVRSASDTVRKKLFESAVKYDQRREQAYRSELANHLPPKS